MAEAQSHLPDQTDLCSYLKWSGAINSLQHTLALNDFWDSCFKSWWATWLVGSNRLQTRFWTVGPGASPTAVLGLIQTCILWRSLVGSVGYFYRVHSQAKTPHWPSLYTGIVRPRSDVPPQYLSSWNVVSTPWFCSRTLGPESHPSEPLSISNYLSASHTNSNQISLRLSEVEPFWRLSNTRSFSDRVLIPYSLNMKAVIIKEAGKAELVEIKEQSMRPKYIKVKTVAVALNPSTWEPL